MPDGMPFMKQKGPVLLQLENAANQLNKGAAYAMLKALATGDPVAEVIETHLGPSLTHPLTVKNHLSVDWFGHTDASIKQTTGFWVNWKGDIEGIVRQGLIRALELALGLPPLDFSAGLAPIEGTPNWYQPKPSYEDNAAIGSLPLDSVVRLWWLCPQPRFEVAVERDNGTVRIEFHTPAPKDGALWSGYDIEAPTVFDVVGSPKYNHQPDRVRAWVIGQNQVEAQHFLEWFKPANSDLIFTDVTSVFNGHGTVTTVEVKQKFGGINP